MTAPTGTGIRSAIWGFLAEAESLTGATTPGLLGLSDDPRVYPHGAPADSVFPYVVFKRADRPEQRTLAATRGLRSATFDFEVWGDDAVVVEQVVEALRARLESSPSKRGSVSVRSVTLEGEVDDAVRPEDGSEVTWFVTILTARFAYIESSAGA